MADLNRDILYLILEELQDDKNSLHSSLLVSKTWCEIIIYILWRDPWKYLILTNIFKGFSIFKVIVSHLSDEMKNNLKTQGVIDLFMVSSQKPLFNYISFCKHLNLNMIDRILNSIKYHFTDLTYSIIKNEIFNLFIGNTRITHLYLSQQSDYQIHLIPGAKQCFSEMVFLACYTLTNDNIVTGLSKICHSIKELDLFVQKNNNNYGVTKLISNSKKLIGVRLIAYDVTHSIINVNESIGPSYYEILENSLMKHSNTIQYFKSTKPPTTKFLSSLVNLKSLELNLIYNIHNHTKLNYLNNISLPNLQTLKSNFFHDKFFKNLIINSNKYLTEISIDDITHNVITNKNIIQIIHQNCSNLMYLKILIKNENILELEKLLIKCQYLTGIYFLRFDSFKFVDFDKLFEILIKSSSINLFKFKFIINSSFNPISLNLFLQNWNGRKPMLLQIDKCSKNLIDLIEEFKSKGIIKKFNKLWDENHYFDDFEW